MTGRPEIDLEEDRALVARFLATRSEDAFLALYDRHATYLYRFVARLLGEPGGDAADVAQEAWARVVTHLDRFAWRSSLRTWLCGLALNCAREKWRATDRDRRIASALVAEGPEPAASGADPASRAVVQALRDLPPGYREVLLLHDVEGYTHLEIAEHFGIAEGTSKSQLHRARLALRSALNGRETTT